MLGRLLSACLLLALLTGCATTSSTSNSKAQQLATQGALEKVLVLPPDITMSELSAGGMIEKVPQWGKQAEQNFSTALASLHAAGKKVVLVSVPDLPEAEQEALEEHLALYAQVASDAFFLPRAEGWKHKQANFDYTLGPGLAYLRDKTGADIALLVVGQDIISTSERKALSIVGALFGVSVPLGVTFMTTGLVDLQTGNLLWVNYEVSGTGDMRVYKDAQATLQNLIKGFPDNALTLQP